jgi:ubiquinone/menaquinone biosynthesis C-methylase UbiE
MKINENYLATTIKTYDETAREYAENVKNILPQQEFDKFISMVPINSFILDIGCGSGVATRCLSEAGYKNIGIDLSQKLLNEAKTESPNTKFYKMDMRNLNFGSDSFDGIWCCASLLHLKKEEVPLTLRGFNKILKPRGSMYISIKEGEGEGMEEDKRYNGKPKWYSYYKQSEINSLLNNAGFNVLENYCIQCKDTYRMAHPWMSIFCNKK